MTSSLVGSEMCIRDSFYYLDWECLCGSQEQGRRGWLPRTSWVCSDAWQQGGDMERGGGLVSGEAF
eukprot:10983873-Prorocentrum_lima.AAC.1